MTFFKFLSVAAIGLLPLAACSGKSETPRPPATSAENSVENHTPAAETSTPKAPDTSLPASETAEKTIAPEFANLPEPYNTADYARGRRVFKLCTSCHTTAEGAGPLVGPNLYGIFGRKAGSAEGFSYSKAFQEADITWTPEQIDAYITNPRTFLKGNRMTFSGVRKADDRTALIAYLMTETGYDAEK